MGISEIFKIKKGITSIIGGGGKTSLMYALANDLSSKGKVIVCTSTKIFIPEHMPVIYDKSNISSALDKCNLICVGKKFSDNKLSSPEIPIEKLMYFADYVIVEADGSKGLPFKAHSKSEPVIPDKTNLTILVIGINSIGKYISDVCHRKEIAYSILNLRLDTPLSPQHAAKIINKEHLHDFVFINQAESEKDLINAKYLSELINTPVIAGSVKKGWFKWLS